RGCVDHLLDPGLDRRLEHVERSAHKDIDAFSRAFSAECDPNGGLVKHVVAAGNNLHDCFAISHVALHKDKGKVGPHHGKILQAAPDEIIQDPDFPSSFLE